MIQKIFPYIEVMRPGLMVLSIVASVCLLIYSNNFIFPKSILIVLTIVSFNTFFNMCNELLDEDTDRIIKPHKPIPSGRVNRDIVKFLMFFMFLIGFTSLILLVYYYGIYYLILGCMGLFGGFIYNVFREKGLIGNFALGMTYFSAAMMSSNDLVFSVGFGSLTMAFNVAVQIEDVYGDLLANINTLPIEFDINFSKIFSIFLAVISFFFLSKYGVFFTLCPILVILSVIIDKKVVYKVLLRYICRIFMLCGFLCLVI